MQRDTTGLTAENKELKLRLQAMEQQAQLREGMHDLNCFCHVLSGVGIWEIVERIVSCGFSNTYSFKFIQLLCLNGFLLVIYLFNLLIIYNWCCYFGSTALNEKLREEVQRLKIATGQMQTINGNPFNRGLPQFASHQPALHPFGGPQAQQQQQPHHMLQSSNNNQTRNGQPNPSFMDYNQRV